VLTFFILSLKGLECESPGWNYSRRDLHANFSDIAVNENIPVLESVSRNFFCATRYLHQNSLTGTIPPDIGNLTALTALWVKAFLTSSSDPYSFFLSLRSMHNNVIYGTISTQIGMLAALQFL